MADELSVDEQAIIAQELGLLRKVQAQLAEHVASSQISSDFDNELLTLRDQLLESRAEDHAMLVEHMTRIAALRAAQDRERVFPVDPGNPYFARLRLEDKFRDTQRVREVCIGRRAFIDTRKGVQIVDWRNSPISRIYYCYNEGDEYEERFANETQNGRVAARRTVTVREGELTRVRAGDETLLRTQDGWLRESAARARLAGGSGTSLRPPSDQFIDRPDGRLPEITALIDPDQFKIITGERSGVVIIRGGAGTGKTTIALHRAAWLHFQDGRRYAAKRMLIITPGDALRRYVASVLPTLDVSGVPIRTFPIWALETAKRLIPSIRKRKATDDTPMGARRLKRHPALLTLLEQVVQAEARDFEPVIQDAGGPALLDAWVRRRNMPVMQRIEATEKWLDRGGDAAFTRGQMVAIRKALSRAKSELGDPFETWVDALTNRARLEAAFHAAGDIPLQWELDQLVRTVTEQSDDPINLDDYDPSHRTGIDGRGLDHGSIRSRLDVDDAAIMLRICQLKYGRMTGPSNHVVRYEHVMVDEAQDLSPLCIQVLCGLVPPGGPVTLAGDTAQRLVLDNGFANWDDLAKSLHLKAHVLPPLAVSYRSTRQVMLLARHVLGELATEDAPRDARDGAPVALMRFDEMGEAVGFLADALKSLRDRERRASVALVAPNAEVADLYHVGLRRAQVPNLRRVRNQEFDFTPGIDLTDIMQIKGLEYDYVVLLEATAQHFPSTDEARFQFHVVATRAAHQLWLVCSRAPSLLLPDWLIEGRDGPDEPTPTP
jgi:DNA helicase-2/ATP-dependent DNA helicase PcrA